MPIELWVLGGFIEPYSFWVPEGSESEFKLLAKACVDNRDLVPVACRCARTGCLVFPDR